MEFSQSFVDRFNSWPAFARAAFVVVFNAARWPVYLLEVGWNVYVAKVDGVEIVRGLSCEPFACPCCNKISHFSVMWVRCVKEEN
jgi:hypothetical protein